MPWEWYTRMQNYVPINPIIAMEKLDDNINETNCRVPPEFYVVLNFKAI